MKPKNTNLISMGYIKDKSKYYATFQISNMDTEHRKRIIEQEDLYFEDKDCEIFVAGLEVYIINYLTNIEFEVYASIVELAKKGVTPERIDPVALEQELDICMLEQDMDIDLLQKSPEELGEHYNHRLKDFL